MTEAVSRQ